jgi:hypothetical protein
VSGGTGGGDVGGGGNVGVVVVLMLVQWDAWAWQYSVVEVCCLCSRGSASQQLLSRHGLKQQWPPVKCHGSLAVSCTVMTAALLFYRASLQMAI